MASTKNLVHPFFLVDIKWGSAKVSKVESWSRRDRSCSQQPLQPWPETFGCKTTGQLSAFWIPSATSDKKMRRPAECHVAFAKVWFCIVPTDVRVQATFLCQASWFSSTRNHFNSCPVFEFVATHRVYSLKASLDRMEDSRQEGRNSLNSLVFSVDQFQLRS
jgi:hypothetical protein